MVFSTRDKFCFCRFGQVFRILQDCADLTFILSQTFSIMIWRLLAEQVTAFLTYVTLGVYFASYASVAVLVDVL